MRKLYSVQQASESMARRRAVVDSRALGPSCAASKKISFKRSNRKPVRHWGCFSRTVAGRCEQFERATVGRAWGSVDGGRIFVPCRHDADSSDSLGIALGSLTGFFYIFSTILVGAAGFEPATWSTQNSRATRLRYAPAPCRA